MKPIIINSLQELTNYLVKELKLKPGEILNIKTPQFERTCKIEITWKPQTVDEFDIVCKDLSKAILKKMGVCPFGKVNGKMLYLFPGEWFNNIPEGYPVICIDGKQHSWNSKTCDNDIRYGCLAYGFLR